MSFGDHLDELRSCLILALVGVGVASAITLFFGRQILILICRPLWTVQFANGLQPSLQALSPTAAFSAYLKIAFLAGLIVSMPWVLHQFWRFVAAGLYVHERRFVKRLLPASMGLFAIGVVFLYFIVLPIVLNFFIWFNRAFELHDLAPTGFQSLLLSDEVATPATSWDATPLAVPILDKNPEHPEPGYMWFNAATRRLMVQGPDGILSTAFTSGEMAPAMQSQFAIDFYISFVLMLALAFGIAFETPLVVFFLAWSGILTRDRMARARRYVLLLVVVVAAVLTPPDPTSQLLLAIPMYLLFELGLWAARFVEGKYPTESAG
jgi:sec-independent protein translocase protein TatC